jgi:hypothetical protein
MAIDYSSILTPEQKRSILEQRIQQFAAEAFQHDLNRQVAENTGDTDGMANAAAAIATIDEAIAVHQNELVKLPDETAAT